MDGILSVDYFYERILSMMQTTNAVHLVAIAAVVLILLLRVAQRVYYLLRGHRSCYYFNPRKEMELFIKKNDIVFKECSLISKRDKVCLRYRKLGTGPKNVLLNNGVGTDFYMWLPTIQGSVLCCEY